MPECVKVCDVFQLPSFPTVKITLRGRSIHAYEPGKRRQKRDRKEKAEKKRKTADCMS